MSGLLLHEERRRKLIASARLLESDLAGERQAAVDAMRRLLPSGVTVADMLEKALPVALPALVQSASPRPEPVSPLRRWQRKARMIAMSPDHLNERELSFLKDMAVRPDEPSPKQFDWLDNLVARVEARAGL